MAGGPCPSSSCTAWAWASCPTCACWSRWQPRVSRRCEAQLLPACRRAWRPCMHACTCPRAVEHPNAPCCSLHVVVAPWPQAHLVSVVHLCRRPARRRARHRHRVQARVAALGRRLAGAVLPGAPGARSASAPRPQPRKFCRAFLRQRAVLAAATGEVTAARLRCARAPARQHGTASAQHRHSISSIAGSQKAQRCAAHGLHIFVVQVSIGVPCAPPIMCRAICLRGGCLPLQEHPSPVAHLTLLDPICFHMFVPRLLKNFLYR